jgi:integrase
VSSKSQTLGPDRDEAQQLYAAARSRSPRDYALVSLLLHQGLRASEACHLDRDHVGSERGHRTLVVHRKGGEEQRMALAPVAAEALGTYLASRTDGLEPLFLAGQKAASYPRMTRQQVADVTTGCVKLSAIGRT